MTLRSALSLRWHWLTLGLYLPLATLASHLLTFPLGVRLGVVHGVASLWCVLTLLREGRLEETAPLLRRPLTHGLAAILGFAVLLPVMALLRQAGTEGTSTAGEGVLLLGNPIVPGLRGMADAMIEAGPDRIVQVILGAAAEEWIFRGALLMRWVAPPPAGRDGSKMNHAPPSMAVGMKLLAVTLYFAALHAAQGPVPVIMAFSGGMALGALLLWRRSLVLVAALHALYNVANLP